MSRSFTLPDLGEGIHEAEVLAVRVVEGAEVKEGDVILEVETDKAAVEIPSPFTGKVDQILTKAGDLVKVGDVMLVFAGGDEAQSSEQKPVEVPSGQGVKKIQEKDPKAQKAAGPVPASPATRKLARELGVDLQLVPPTGAKGLVTADDVRTFAQRGKETGAAPIVAPVEEAARSFPVSAPALPDFSQWGEVERRPLRSVRRSIARQMATAWSQIPHVTSQDMVDIGELEAFRRKHKEEIEAIGGRLTMTVFAMKAAATALKAHPIFNSSLDLEAQEIVVKKYYNIGVAVDTEDGLIVPVIRDVDRKSIKELAVELHDCVQRTRSRKIGLEELQGGTFTITNAGAMGGGFFTPIINFPQTAILGLGQGRMQPTVITKEDGSYEMVPRLLMPVVVCFDHRVADGGDSIRFMKVLIEALKDPEELLISMI
jgi:pyruvate dehydrogenase E2 component (dihydrolipoamide acetyltransferase)